MGMGTETNTKGTRDAGEEIRQGNMSSSLEENMKLPDNAYEMAKIFLIHRKGFIVISKVRRYNVSI